jgi:methionyl aminopeptidase
MISIKTSREIDNMRKAGEIVAMAHKKIEEAISPGITTLQLDRIAYEIITGSGATPSFLGYENCSGGDDYPASICASVNEEVIHGIPGLRKLEDGDIISIDIGAEYNGFHGDMARTYAVGRVSEEAMNLIKAAEESFFRGMGKAVAGNWIRDISAAIQDYTESCGFSVVRDFVGHGIGRKMHEAPQIPNYRTKQRGPRLQKGMTLAIEPMINRGGYGVRLLDNFWTVVTADGSLSAHYENTVLVTDGEPEILTRLY